MMKSQLSDSNTLKHLIVGFLLAILTFHTFSDALFCDFVSIDDPFYVYENPHVTGGLTQDSIVWAFRNSETGNWHPLTWLSHMLDIELFGLNPRGHHLTSLIIHVINTLLCFWLFSLWTGRFWTGFFIALFFGTHPLRAESVVWISERKDLLCAFFGFLSLLAYTAYTQSRQKKFYLFTGIFLFLGLLSKAMLVTWPFLFLLMDYWPLHRFTCNGAPNTIPRQTEYVKKDFKGLFLEKIPFFIIVLFFCLISLLAQHSGGAVVAVSDYSFVLRIQNAILSYVRYLAKGFFPVRLSVFYPILLSSNLSRAAVGSVLLLGSLTALLFRFRKKKPYLIVGWLWYLGTLVPVIGIVQIGFQSMADRYTYLPCLGILLLVIQGMSDLWSKGRPFRIVLIPSALLAGLFFLVCSWTQTNYWKNNLTLYGHAARVTHNNPLVWFHYGSALEQTGDYGGAIEQYEKIFDLYPGSPDPYISLGRVYFKQGHYQQAESAFYKACELTEFKYPNSLEMLADTCYHLNKLGEALHYAEKSISLLDPSVNPEQADMLLRLQSLKEKIHHNRVE